MSKSKLHRNPEHIAVLEQVVADVAAFRSKLGRDDIQRHRATLVIAYLHEMLRDERRGWEDR